MAASESMGTMSAAALLEDISFTYDGGGTWALSHLDLTVERGERLCILGANGSGKSTLAQLLAGLEAPDKGRVTLDGRLCFDGAPHGEAYEAARRTTGLVFQNPADQMVTTVVADDVAFGPENLRWSPQRIGEVVARALHRVAMEPFAEADPSRLSGGQQQRVALAGALAMEPTTLILDEPAAQLDVRGRRSLLALLEKVQGDHTIVHITHFMDEALAADRVVVMDRGTIATMGTPAEVFSQGRRLRELGLEEPFPVDLAHRLDEEGVTLPGVLTWDDVVGALVLRLQAVEKDGDPGEVASPVPAMDGEIPTAGPATAPGSADGMDGIAATGDAGALLDDGAAVCPDPIIHARGLRFSYGDNEVLHGLDFQCPRGLTTALLGPTGSGKSTLMRLLVGLTGSDGGELVVDGVPCARKRDRRRLLGRVGYMMQRPERQLFADTVAADVAFGPRNLGLKGEELDRRVADALEFCGLEDLAGRSPFDLSGGQQRLCALAGILAMDPAILVMDEPMDGLDPKGRDLVRHCLEALHDQGRTIVLVDHDMDDVATLAHHCLVLDQGLPVLHGSPREVFSHGELLHSIGLGLPQPLAMAQDLEKATGRRLGAPLTMDALVEAVVDALGVTGHGEVRP